MKKLLFICIFMASSFAFSAFAETLHFCTDDFFPPYSYEENGEVTGIDYDVVKEVAKRVGFEVKIRLVPWKRLLKWTREGNKMDGSFSLFRTPEREQYAIYALNHPIHYSTYVLFVKKGNEFKFDTLKDLYKLTVGMNSGFSISDEFDEAVKKGKIKREEIGSIDNNIKKLLRGRIDAFVGQTNVVLYTLKKMGLKEKITFLPKPVKKSRGAYLVISKASRRVADKQGLIKKINTAMEEIVSDGTYERIIDKYIK